MSGRHPEAARGQQRLQSRRPGFGCQIAVAQGFIYLSLGSLGSQISWSHCLQQAIQVPEGRPSFETDSGGRARWTVRLLAEEAVKRKLVPRVGRETVQIFLESHDLKPWRGENAVRGQTR